jgi:predicted RNA-binding Zn ribbon-like protein
MSVIVEGIALPHLLGGRLCLDFANTVGSHLSPEPYEYLTSYQALARWGQHTEILTSEEAMSLIAMAEHAPAAAHAVLERAIALREAIFAVFGAISEQQPVDDEALAILNAEFVRSMAHVQVRKMDGAFEWGWQTTSDMLDCVLWSVARSAAELLIAPELDRVRMCPGPDGCGWLFLDMSKNRSRRWCSMDDCGNVAKQRRHQHKARTVS